MKVSLSTQPLHSTACDVRIVLLEEGAKLDQAALGSQGAVVAAALKAEQATGETHELTRISGEPRTLVVGLGKAGGAPPAVRWHRALVVGLRALRGHGAARVAVEVPGGGADAAQALADAAVTAEYDPGAYKTKDAKPSVKEVVLVATTKNKAELEAAIARGVALGEAANYTRRLVNAPSNQKSPEMLASEARRLAKRYGMQVEVLDVAAMRREGMGALLAVAQGSQESGRLIHLTYRGAKAASRAKPPIFGVVGKGVTFDSGGLSLKPGKDMHLMKFDMGGAAAVLGAFQALGELKPALEVHGVIPSVENMPDGQAYRPSDVLTAMNGKTIEVLNTDAEGRLILADALCYAQRQGVTHIVDLATLTGAVIVALGHGVSGLMGNDRRWTKRVADASEACGEPAWELPLVEDYKAQIKSLVADVQNIGDDAGTIIGGLFLSEFVDGARWAHLDIAGTVWADSESNFRGKGPTGVGVRTIVRLAEELASGA